jgi:hypothetical protein
VVPQVDLDGGVIAIRKREFGNGCAQMLQSMLAVTTPFMNGVAEDVVVRTTGSSLALSMIQLNYLTSHSRTLILASIMFLKIACAVSGLLAASLCK